MNKNWENCYVGLPYKLGGRDRSGIDCWGLVRLIHKEQMGIDLPAFADVISLEDQAETISREKEGWNPVVIEQTGDVVLFNILGNATHVGIVTRPGFFIHAFENQDVRVERLDSAKWKKRIAGIYRYSAESKGANLIGLAHPLKTERIDTLVEAGRTLAELHTKMKQLANVSEDYDSSAVIYVDSKLVPKEQWETTVVQNGQRVEYRATVQGGGGGFGGIFKVVAAVALAYFAPMMAGQLYSALGGTFVMANASAIITGMTIGINVLGGVLLNAIFPTRPPSVDSPSVYANEEGTPSYFLQGGNNQANKFGAIPVVLGTMRYTPPIAAETYAEAEDVNSYLRMVLCWGYGPLQINNITIGDDPLSNFSEVQIETLQGYSTDNRTTFDSIYGQDVEQQRVAVELTDTTTWVTRVLDEEVDQLSFMFEYPNGLYKVNEQNGEKTNNQSGVVIQYRPIGSGTWLSGSQTVNANSFQLNPAYPLEFTDVSDGVTSTVNQDVYQWSSIVVDTGNNLVIKHGSPVPSINGTPDQFHPGIQVKLGILGSASSLSRLPSISSYEIELYRICTHNGAVVSSSAVTPPLSGCALSLSGLTASVSSGTVNNPTGDLFLDKKALSPFVKTKTYNVPRAKYEVRVRRTTDGYNSYDAYRVTFGSITGYKNTKPINFNKPLAMSAIRIKSSNQFNGQVDGFVGTVSSICKKWNGTAWVDGTTSNPAALYRYVLQHPSNAKPLTDEQIDLIALQDWYEYCEDNGWQYNSVLTGQKSLYEVLKDIAAAGRASPTRYNSKWSVIVDKPRDTIIQHLTPHNSWGFEGTKNLPKLPHAFKVAFVNESKTYQPDELFVYNDGYDESNATLFEGLELPGITNPSVVHKQARFHMAQLKLRPEVYTLNVDIEHLVCNRGDLVRVTHDTPMWGLGSGRIKQKVSSTELLLDEPMPMQVGKQYTVRIRNQDGSSTVKTVASKPADDYYDSITLTSALSSTQGKEQDLFLFGELNSESVDLIVLAVEPSNNLTARLTLVDYSPEIYDVDTVPIPEFNSKITLPPGLLRNKVQSVPNLTIQSGDYAVVELSPGVWQYGMRVSWDTNPSLVQNITHVEVQIDWVGDNTEDWLIVKKVPVTEGSIYFNNDVRIGEGYVIRARYINAYGATGRWSNEVTHYIEGREGRPMDVEDFLIFNNVFSWKNLTAPDIAGYKIKYSYANNPSWESATDLTTGLVLSSPYQAVSVPDGTVTFFIKAIDTLGNESFNATRIVRNLGDSPVANVIVSYDYEADNYPGSITGGSIVGSDILANSNSLMYQSNTLPFYDFDTTVFYVDNYDAVTWISSGYTPVRVLFGSAISLNYQFDGNAPQIWYRLTGPNPFFSTQGDSNFYAADTAPFYELVGEWRVWPGSIPAEITEYQFKFSDASGPVQGRLNSFEVVVDAPDKVLRLNDVAIGSSGTRLTDAIGVFDTILNIQLTLQNSTADVLYAEDKSVTLGPMIKAKQGATGVTATVDAFIQGY